MAIRVGQTPLIIEDQFTSGHLRVGQTALIIESVPPPTGHIRVGQLTTVFEVTANSLLPSISGGAFQDPLGNPLSGGTITFQLSVDAVDPVTGVNAAISSKYVGKGLLDVNGNITQPFQIWPNSLLTPTTTYYKVKVYTAGGQLVWMTPVVIPNTYPAVNFGNIIPQQ